MVVMAGAARPPMIGRWVMGGCGQFIARPRVIRAGFGAGRGGAEPTIQRWLRQGVTRQSLVAD
jgi:hypothetical protein